MQSGNWVFQGSDTTTALAPLHLGAAITQSGANVTIAFAPLSPCLPGVPLPTTTAAVTANGLNIRVVFGDATLSMDLTGTSTQLAGSYSISGGCANGDHGSVQATYVPPVTGTWIGTVSGIVDPSQTQPVSLTIAQSDTTVFAFYTLTGTAQFPSSSCMTSATIGTGSPSPTIPATLPSTITGTTLTLYLTSGSNTANMIATLVPPDYGKQMSLIISGSTFDNASSCPDLMGTGILTKQ